MAKIITFHVNKKIISTDYSKFDNQSSLLEKIWNKIEHFFASKDKQEILKNLKAFKMSENTQKKMNAFINLKKYANLESQHNFKSHLEDNKLILLLPTKDNQHVKTEISLESHQIEILSNVDPKKLMPALKLLNILENKNSDVDEKIGAFFELKNMTKDEYKKNFNAEIGNNKKTLFINNQTAKSVKEEINLTSEQNKIVSFVDQEKFMSVLSAIDCINNKNIGSYEKMEVFLNLKEMANKENKQYFKYIINDNDEIELSIENDNVKFMEQHLVMTESQKEYISLLFFNEADLKKSEDMLIERAMKQFELDITRANYSFEFIGGSKKNFSNEDNENLDNVDYENKKKFPKNTVIPLFNQFQKHKACTVLSQTLHHAVLAKNKLMTMVSEDPKNSIYTYTLKQIDNNVFIVSGFINNRLVGEQDKKKLKQFKVIEMAAEGGFTFPQKIDSDIKFLITENKIFCLKSVIDVIPYDETITPSLGLLTPDNRV